MGTTAIYYAPTNRRSRLISEVMAQSAGRMGVKADVIPSIRYSGKITHDNAIFYGLSEGLRRVFDDYRKEARAVYVDLGYWGRRKMSRYDGYHKLAVNSRHATAYFQNKRHDEHRFKRFGIGVLPWRKGGRHILVAGMSAKAAYAEGLKPEQWERDTIFRLRKLTDRPIIYRPKPNWMAASLIAGSAMQRDVPLPVALKNCHAVVTHHSNVAIDAILAGVPAISEGGLASIMGSTSIEEIENPLMPNGRAQWAADIAWTQWSVEEMRAGRAWRYLLEEGLIV